MFHKKLVNRYHTIINALTIIKIYNIVIVLLSILAYFLNFEQFSLLLFLVALNCILNIVFFKRICDFMNKLNQFFEQD
jgi:hypothetical protein